MKVRVGKFKRCLEMSQADWLATPIWEVQWRFDTENYARPIKEPVNVTRDLISGRRIAILVRCEQFDRYALAGVRSARQLDDISVFWGRSAQPVDRLAAARFPFYVVAIPPIGRESSVRFVWNRKGSRFARRVASTLKRNP